MMGIIGRSRLVSRVLYRLHGSSHSSRPAIAHWLKQPTRFLTRSNAMWKPIWSCSGWSLPCYGLLPTARCALTAPFHPYLCTTTRKSGPSAVFSLLHLSWACAPQALPGTLLYGARTFLPSTSLPKDSDEAATTQSTPGANCIDKGTPCLVRSHFAMFLCLNIVQCAITLNDSH